MCGGTGGASASGAQSHVRAGQQAHGTELTQMTDRGEGVCGTTADRAEGGCLQKTSAKQFSVAGYSQMTPDNQFSAEGGCLQKTSAKQFSVAGYSQMTTDNQFSAEGVCQQMTSAKQFRVGRYSQMTTDNQFRVG